MKQYTEEEIKLLNDKFVKSKYNTILEFIESEEMKEEDSTITSDMITTRPENVKAVVTLGDKKKDKEEEETIKEEK